MSEPTQDSSWQTYLTAVISGAVVGLAWLVDKILTLRKKKLKDDQELVTDKEEADERAEHEAEVHEQHLKERRDSISITQYQEYIVMRNKEEERWKAEYERIFSRQQDMVDKMQTSIQRLNKQHNECLADSIKTSAEMDVLRKELAGAIQETQNVKKRLAEMEALVGKQVQLPAWPEPPPSE